MVSVGRSCFRSSQKRKCPTAIIPSEAYAAFEVESEIAVFAVGSIFFRNRPTLISVCEYALVFSEFVRHYDCKLLEFHRGAGFQRDFDEFFAFNDRYGKIVVDGIVGSLPRVVDFVDEIKTEFHNFILRFSRLYANTTISFLHSRLVISDNIFTLSREVEKNDDMGYDLENVR